MLVRNLDGPYETLVQPIVATTVVEFIQRVNSEFFSGRVCVVNLHHLI